MGRCGKWVGSSGNRGNLCKCEFLFVCFVLKCVRIVIRCAFSPKKVSVRSFRVEMWRLRFSHTKLSHLQVTRVVLDLIKTIVLFVGDGADPHLTRQSYAVHVDSDRPEITVWSAIDGVEAPKFQPNSAAHAGSVRREINAQKWSKFLLNHNSVNNAKYQKSKQYI